MRKIFAAIALLGLALTQKATSQNAARTEVRMQSPTDKAAQFPLALIQSETAKLDKNKQLTYRLLEGGNYNINIRHLTARETAMVHGRIADIWVITEGGGTLVTGGELVGAKSGTEGDKTGTAIRGGLSQPAQVGDVFYIPPGLPHQMAEVDGKVTYLNIRFDEKTLRENRAKP